MSDAPFRFPGEPESARTASRDRLDAAVLAHRDDPSDANRRALQAAMEAHHEAFLAEQVEEFQDRTRRPTGRYSDWTADNVEVLDRGRGSAVYEDDAPQRRAGDPYPPRG